MKTRTFTGTIGRTTDETLYAYEESDPTPPGAPNVLVIVVDDMGFSQLGCFGSDIDTPNIDRLADEGLRYNNFHTTSVCSATRASLLTGTNHHAAGVPALVDTPTGATNNPGRLKGECATLAEVLHEFGYATFAVGKWHLDSDPTGVGNPIGWPLQKGFDRYYGFLHAENDQFHPNLVRDNTPAPQPKTPEEGYHFSEDITDNMLAYLYNHHMNFPDQPFFAYVAFGAQHAPHHAPREFIERYRGRFDKGWDELRGEWYARQKEIGIIPADARLTPRNDRVPAWSSLSERERAVAAREMEAFAGMLEHTDVQVGRIIDFLRESDQLDDTLVIFLSDNGASCEGGPLGRFNSMTSMDMVSSRDGDVDWAFEHLDEIGSEFAFNHYASGWANLGNVPFPWYKLMAHSGGVKDPLIVRYPREVAGPGGVRTQYHHVSDIMPTVLDVVGVEKPAFVKGVAQREMSGTSMRYTFADADAPTTKHVQYYEVFGNRGIWKDGWKAIVNHTFSETYDDDVWELYHTDVDYSESEDVAERHPDKLAELKEAFLYEAGRNDVFPMMPGSMHAAPGLMARTGSRGAIPEKTSRFRHVTHPFILVSKRDIAAFHASSAIAARIRRDTTDQGGVIYSQGGRFGGVALFVKDNRLVYAYNANYPQVTTVRSTCELDVGEVEVAVAVEVTGGASGVGASGVGASGGGAGGASDGASGGGAGLAESGAGGRVVEVAADGEPWAHVTLFVNGEAAGEGEIAAQGGMAGFASSIGANFYSAVSDEYEVPFAFTGELEEVVLHQSAQAGDPRAELRRLLAME